MTGFVDIDLPADFILEVRSATGEWIDWGRYQARNFSRTPEGIYVCAGHGGSPLILRCLRQDGDLMDVLDGAGELYTYRLVPFPSNRYRPV